MAGARDGEDEAVFQTSLEELWVLPADDTGATTAARYRFQSEVIARDAIACLVTGRGAVVCEWQQDAIVIHGKDDVELLSVKHIEVSQGRWTRRQLIDAGGLRQLFERWQATGRRARCRLATNGGLDVDARGLRDSCASGNDEAIKDLAHDICGPFGVDADALVPFLKVLRIEDELPTRRYIGTVNVASMMAPALKKLGLTAVAPESAYEAIVRAVELASRDRPETADSLDVVLDPAHLDELTRTRRRLADRTLGPARLRLAVSEVRGSERVRLIIGAGTNPTALEQKLHAGGFGPTAIQSAKALRASWSLFEKETLDPLGEFGELDGLAVRLIDAAAEAEIAAMASPDLDGSWGRRMHQILRERLTNDPVPAPPFVPKQRELLEGFVYELTDKCHIWWSDRFDLGVAS